MSVKAYIYCATNGWVAPGSSVRIDIDRNMILCSAVFDNFSSYPGGKMITTISTGNYGSYQTTFSNDEPEGSSIQQQNGVTITDFDQMSVGSSKTVAISFDAYMTDAAGNIVERDAFTTTATITRVSSSSGDSSEPETPENVVQFGAIVATVIDNETIYMQQNMPEYFRHSGDHTYLLNYRLSFAIHSVRFVSTVASIDSPRWIPYTYNNQQCYISMDYVIDNITYYEALSEQKICTIDGTLYRLEIMPLDFWQNLPSDIIASLGDIRAWTSTEYSDGYMIFVIHYEGDTTISTDSGYVDMSSGHYVAHFVPVLVAVDDIRVGDKIYSGYWSTTDSSNTTTYHGYTYGTDSSFAYKDQTDVQLVSENGIEIGASTAPLKWLVGAHNILLCQSFGIRNITYDQISEYLLNKTIEFAGHIYKCTLVSQDALFDMTSTLNITYDKDSNYQFNINDNLWYAFTNDTDASGKIVSALIDTYNPYTYGTWDWDTTISYDNSFLVNSYDSFDDVYYVPILVRVDPPTIDVGQTDLGSLITWTDLLYSIDSTANVTITEYLNGEIINPVVIDFDPSVNNIFTYHLDSTEFSNLPIGQVNTIRITAENLGGMAEATITFTKSDGKIKLGYWDAISATGKTTNFYPTGEIQSIVGSAYSEIVLNTSGTSENLYTWIPFTANDKQFYICDQFGINHISYHEVFNKIININTDVVIDGYNYRLTLLKLEDLAYVKDINYNFYPAASIINDTIDGSYCCLVSMVQGIYGITIDTDNIVFNAHNTDDRHSNLYYIPILVKTEASVVRILYSGNNNLGVISQPPSIIYSTKGATGNVQIEESVGGKVINNRVSSVGATNTFTISESTWKTLEADKQLYITIKVTDVNNNTDSLVIAFTKLHICNRINFHVGPLTTPKRCDYILAAANTDATDVGIIAVKFYACNNVYDDIPTWIEGVKDDSTSDPLVGFDFSTCTSKTSSQWGVAIKIVVESQDKMDNLIICGMNGVAIRLEDGSYF